MLQELQVYISTHKQTSNGVGHTEHTWYTRMAEKETLNFLLLETILANP